MLVMSNIFRINHPPPKHTLTSKSANDLNVLDKSKSDKKIKRRTLNSFGSFKSKNSEIVTSAKESNEANPTSDENNLSDSKNVIPSAKGLLETNLDELFSETEKHSSETCANSVDSKLHGPNSVIECDGNVSTNGLSHDSVTTGTSENGYDDGDTTDSDCVDEVIREQNRCVGARRFGYILRRVISRNGK